MRTAIIVHGHYALGAERGIPDRDPVALAIEDQAGIKAHVLGPAILIEGRFGRRALAAGDRVGRFVHEWDNNLPVDLPFAFILDTDDIAEGFHYGG